MNAAAYIDAPILTDHGTTYIAEKLFGKPAKEVAELLNVGDDFQDDVVKDLTEQLEKIVVDESENKDDEQSAEKAKNEKAKADDREAEC